MSRTVKLATGILGILFVCVLFTLLKWDRISSVTATREMVKKATSITLIGGRSRNDPSLQFHLTCTNAHAVRELKQSLLKEMSVFGSRRWNREFTVATSMIMHCEFYADVTSIGKLYVLGTSLLFFGESADSLYHESKDDLFKKLLTIAKTDASPHRSN